MIRVIWTRSCPFCRKEKIDAVTTLIDPEIALLAQNRERFEQIRSEMSGRAAAANLVRKDAGEMGAGHSVTALFEVKLKGGPGSGRIGVARLRYKTDPRSEGVEFSREIADEAVSRTFEQASHAFRTAYVAARFAEHLRKSYWVKEESLAALQPIADELPESQPTNELADLIRKATRVR